MPDQTRPMLDGGGGVAKVMHVWRKFLVPSMVVVSAERALTDGQPA